MSVSSIQEKQLQPFVQQYENESASLPGQSGEMKQFRKQALLQFMQMGFPTLRDEDWRFTSLKPMLSKPFQLSMQDHVSSEVAIDPAAFLIEGLQSYQIIFVDASLHTNLATLDLPEGVHIQSVSQVAQNQPDNVHRLLSDFETPVDNGFVALNNASVGQGLVIEVAPNIVLDKAIELVFIGGNSTSWSQPRVILKVGENAQLELVERHISMGDEKYASNLVAEVELKSDAKLDWYILQQQSHHSYHVASGFVKQHAKSELTTHTVSLGGGLIRNQLTVQQIGVNAKSTLNGVYALTAKQHVDNHTRLIHSVENGQSNELYKGVLDQRSHCVFHGRIKVEQDAQRIDSKQANHTLLLSRDAEIDTKPQLEIYADDVKCAHGATVGELDKTALFYLQTRGINQKQARALLTYAFLNEVIELMSSSAIKDYLETKLEQQFLTNI